MAMNTRSLINQHETLHDGSFVTVHQITEITNDKEWNLGIRFLPNIYQVKEVTS